MNPELIADAVPLANPMQRDPRTWRVRDVVVKVVVGRPAGHRTLLDAVSEATRLRVLEQRDELRLELGEVLLHREPLVAADEPAHGADPEPGRRVEYTAQELVLLPPDDGIVVQQVVEVGDVGQRDAACVERGLHAPGARGVECAPQVERVRHRIEHRVGRHIGFARMKSRRQLQLVGAKLRGKLRSSPRRRDRDRRRGPRAASVPAAPPTGSPPS